MFDKRIMHLDLQVIYKINFKIFFLNIYIINILVPSIAVPILSSSVSLFFTVFLAAAPATPASTSHHGIHSQNQEQMVLLNYQQNNVIVWYLVLLHQEVASSQYDNVHINQKFVPNIYFAFLNDSDT